MILAIAGKELRALFASPLAWVILTVMQFLFGYNFLRRIDDFLQIRPRLSHMASPPGATELVAAPTFGTAAVVVVVVADAEALEEMGPNPLDPAKRAVAVAAGRRQGGATSADVRRRWLAAPA